MRKYKGNENIKYTHELAPKVKDIAEELGNIGKLPRERLKTLEKFCIALGDNVSVYAKPFRKYLVA